MPNSKTQPPRERNLSDIDWTALTKGRAYHSSPAVWQDQLLYFLLVDRFSDGQEYGGFADIKGNPVGQDSVRKTPLFNLAADKGNADRDQWFKNGQTWCHGKLAGLKDKLGYLQRMGVTAVWISPIFKQVTKADTYHGYGIQNFLDVDPNFGTREELRDLVAAAHGAGINVVLDIILNHAGDIFAYQGDNSYFYWQGQSWPPAGFRADINDHVAGGAGSLPFGPAPSAWPDGAIWPAEFQGRATWTCEGQIRNWDTFPEYMDGDFDTLKDIDHGASLKDPAQAWDLEKRIRSFQPAPALDYLIQVFKFWIAYADVDGYRVDTVKHMEPGAMRLFNNAIHEYAQTLGKENFFLVGEVTGGRDLAVDTVNYTGLDAALGLDIQDKMEFLAKGYRNPNNPDLAADSEPDAYFDLFSNSAVDGLPTHQWYGGHVVTMFDNHDQVGTDHKFRFCGQPGSYVHLNAALALNLFSAGIPCVYYGDEQAFDGHDWRTGNSDADKSFSDAFLRECMFGGGFGSLQSSGRHFFNESHPTYLFLQAASALRTKYLALRRGRQYLRQLSLTGNAGDFWFPRMINGELRFVVAWSRIFAGQELLCAINTDPDSALTVWATVDSRIYQASGQSKLAYIFSTDPAQPGQTLTVAARNGSAVQITLPPAGVVVLGPA